MQTISRANRVFKDKHIGLIVDYIGVFRNLEEALAIYGTRAGGEDDGNRPAVDKGQLIDALREAIAKAEAFCMERQVDLEAMLSVSGFPPSN